jgi:N5-(carboxyethyl)ornithine synthase
MRLGFIIPNHPKENRVALLPEHVKNFENEIVIEEGFGNNLGISDFEYIQAGCSIASREDVFKNCEAIFSLKVIKPSDYHYIREGQIIVGWTHPEGSGKDFMEDQAIPKNLVIVDLDNVHPSVYYKNEIIPIDWIPSNFVRKNSFIAGYSSTMHAILSYGSIPTSETKVAILGSGNVSQGAFAAMNKFNSDVRMFYRKTMCELKNELEEFDIVINGIEMDKPNCHILTLQDQAKLKSNCLVIDAAANAGKAIEGSRHTFINDPIYKENGKYYYAVNNSPSIFYRQSSKAISEAFSKHVYSKDIEVYLDMIKDMDEMIG